VAINDKMEPFSEQAKQAEDRYGITPVTVMHESQGAFKQEEVFLAAAISSGAERVIVPFFGPGTPVEYELVRAIAAIATVAPAKQTKVAEGEAKPKVKRRQTIGIMRTDAQLTGGFNMQNFTQIQPQMIVDELKRQYEVEDLTPGDEVDKEKIDVLVVVQPSSLTPAQLPSVLNAIRAGIPTAIFEDPAPVRFQGMVPATDEPKRSPGGMFGMNQGPQPKCDINELWSLLGVHMVKAKQGRRATGEDALRQDREKGTIEVKVNWEPFTPVVWQHYNPYPKDRNIPDAAVFANPNAPGAKDVFNPAEPAVAGLNEVLFMAPGAFEEAKVKSPEAKGLKFSPIVQTGTDTGLQSLRYV
jgi:ABC-2 type transport system permease protein